MSGMKEVVGGMVHKHELTPGHLNFADTQSVQLDNHLVHRQIVIGVGADANVERSGSLRVNGGRCQTGCERLYEGSSRIRHYLYWTLPGGDRRLVDRYFGGS